MSDREITDASDDLPVLAESYVAGLMSDGEAAAFEARLAADAAARRAVAVARERWHEIDAAASPAPVSQDLWLRIEGGLGSGAQVTNLAAARTARSARAAEQPRGASPRGFWQGFAAASVAASVVGGLLWASLWPTPPRLVVVLLDAEARPVSIVEALDGERIRVVPLGAIDVPKGRTLQVWTLPDPATGPVSMGLLRDVTATVLKGPPLPEPKREQLYEITIEPEGGSPTGKPTGPIVGKGFAKAPQI
jgi:anti-sigma-K factor RskA